MNCPFINLESITDPEMLRAAKAVWNGIACPATGFCDQCDCLKCPFFPEHLRENLLNIELRMLRKKTQQYAFTPPSRNDKGRKPPRNS